MRFAIATLAALLLIAAPAAAGVARERQAKRPPAVEKSPDLWATVNVCDSPAQPDRIGIRGSMPGLGRRAAMWMRFRVQYVAKADGQWHDVDKSADSGPVKLGVSKNRVVEAGHTFKFLPPADGGAHMLRGVVTFSWRVRGHLVKRITEFTEAGHKSTTADPPGYSAAICRIS
jgi:hypothetical protein